MEVAGLIVAAGSGVRAGGKVPKQYQKVNDEAMLCLTIKAFLKSSNIDCIKVVINESDKLLYKDSIKKIDDPRLLLPCLGGNERTDSVRAGLVDLLQWSPRKVLIHDAARPFVSTGLINQVLNELKSYQAVFPVIPVYDALWKIKESRPERFEITPGPERTNLFRAQTPQGFIYQDLLTAYKKNTEVKLDDIAIAYENGLSIKGVLGEESNLKVTSEYDLQRFLRDKCL